MKIKDINKVRYILIILSVLFIIIGVMRGENSEVLQKAINICLQCIGIG